MAVVTLGKRIARTQRDSLALDAGGGGGASSATVEMTLIFGFLVIGLLAVLLMLWPEWAPRSADRPATASGAGAPLILGSPR